MPGDPTPVERRKFARHVARLSLRLKAENAPGGVAVEERTVTENVSLGGAERHPVEYEQLAGLAGGAVLPPDVGEARVQPRPPSAGHENIRQLIGENRQLVRGG